ncbi:MAG TPA: hypothetical protein VL098_04850 [Flavipsychrobacter sp.]|nr:hypothetical protein [Flavipsychrobacter sp.]
MAIYKIAIKNKDKIDNAQLSLENNKLDFIFQDFIISSKNSSPFIALQELRQQLENQDIYLLVNGSRRNVYPSGLQMSMGVATAYVLELGKPSDVIVDIFASISHDDVATVDEQREFHKKWVESIRKL